MFFKEYIERQRALQSKVYSFWFVGGWTADYRTHFGVFIMHTVVHMILQNALVVDGDHFYSCFRSFVTRDLQLLMQIGADSGTDVATEVTHIEPGIV